MKEVHEQDLWAYVKHGGPAARAAAEELIRRRVRALPFDEVVPGIVAGIERDEAQESPHRQRRARLDRLMLGFVGEGCSWSEAQAKAYEAEDGVSGGEAWGPGAARVRTTG